jgi:hypothetical protein
MYEYLAAFYIIQDNSYEMKFENEQADLNIGFLEGKIQLWIQSLLSTDVLEAHECWFEHSKWPAKLPALNQ